MGRPFLQEMSFLTSLSRNVPYIVLNARRRRRKICGEKMSARGAEP